MDAEAGLRCVRLPPEVFVFRKFALVVASTAVAVGSLAAAQAGGAGSEQGSGQRERGPELVLVERPAERFQRSIEAHTKLAEYRQLLAEARRLGLAPAENVLAETAASAAELRAGVEDLRSRIDAARAQAARAQRFAATGVSQATLDTIAACESGGDPTAVNAAGYYGKYQFDLGTWAAVGGRGNPAEASEAEQDHRAALLYARAGSTPWPICG